MAYTLPNGKLLSRPKGVKNKISPAKVAKIHKRLLAILFDVKELTIARQFAAMKLSLRNPSAVREYIDRKISKHHSTWSNRKKIREEDRWDTDKMNPYITDENTIYKPKIVELKEDEKGFNYIEIRQIQRWNKTENGEYKYDKAIPLVEWIEYIKDAAFSPNSKWLVLTKQEKKVIKKWRPPKPLLEVHTLP